MVYTLYTKFAYCNSIIKERSHHTSIKVWYSRNHGAGTQYKEANEFKINKMNKEASYKNKKGFLLTSKHFTQAATIIEKKPASKILSINLLV